MCIEIRFVKPVAHLQSLQAEIKKLKAAHQKQSVQVKTEQKELQTANLELGKPAQNLYLVRF